MILSSATTQDYYEKKKPQKTMLDLDLGLTSKPGKADLKITL